MRKEIEIRLARRPTGRQDAIRNFLFSHCLIHAFRTRVGKFFVKARVCVLGRLSLTSSEAGRKSSMQFSGPFLLFFCFAFAHAQLDCSSLLEQQNTILPWGGTILSAYSEIMREALYESISAFLDVEGLGLVGKTGLETVLDLVWPTGDRLQNAINPGVPM